MVKSRREIALAAGRQSADNARERRHRRYIEEIERSPVTHGGTLAAMAEVLREHGYTVTGPDVPRAAARPAVGTGSNFTQLMADA